MTTSTPMPTAQQLLCARAWRAELIEDSPMPFYITWRDVGPPRAHCAELCVESTGVCDAAVVSSRLGEFLRLVHLATAPHVDPTVLNALCNFDALCTMATASCVRCDAIDHDAAPVVSLAIDEGSRQDDQDEEMDHLSGVRIIHDALYAWSEATASAEFEDLRDALGSSTSDRPPVQINLLVRLPAEDTGQGIRDLWTLVAAMQDGAGSFRLARVFSRLLPESPHFAPLHTTILDLGVSTQFFPFLRPRPTPEALRDAWQWAIDWAERTNARPNVEIMRIIRFPGLTTDILIKLLRLVVADNRTLRRLYMHWPLSPEETEGEHAAEVIGAVLLSPHARTRLDICELSLGNLSDDVVAALERGASSGCGDYGEFPRFQSVKFKVRSASEAKMCKIVDLFGVVGVCELRIESFRIIMSCRVLKAVLQACASTLTTLWWQDFHCDDAIELENPTTWSSFPTQLRRLGFSVRCTYDDNTERALDALLARVGGQLTYVEVDLQLGVFSARVAEIIVARCPRLQTLGISNATSTFFQHLIAAYNEGTCRISNLSLDAFPRWSDTGWSLLFEALQDRTSGATRYVRELKVRISWMDDIAQDGGFTTLLETLSTNVTLRFKCDSLICESGRQLLQTLPHQFVIHPPSLGRRTRSSALSATRKTKSNCRQRYSRSCSRSPAAVRHALNSK